LLRRKQLVASLCYARVAKIPRIAASEILISPCFNIAESLWRQFLTVTLNRTDAGRRRDRNAPIALSKRWPSTRRNLERKDCPNGSLEASGYGAAHGAQTQYRW